MQLLSIALSVMFVALGVFFYLKRLILMGPDRAFVAILGVGCLVGAVTAGVAARNAAEVVWQKGAIAWDHMPLRVYVAPGYTPEQEGKIFGAFAVWNADLKHEAFVAVKEWSAVDVVVQPKDGATICGTAETVVGEHPTITASTVYCDGYVNGYVIIIIPDLDDLSVTFRIMMHEVGHVLGLGHDDVGPMAPDIDGLTTVRNTWPTDKDLAALRQRYFSRGPTP